MTETLDENVMQDEVMEEETFEYVEVIPPKVVDIVTEETEVDVDGVIYIDSVTYRVFDNGDKVQACSSRRPKPSDEPIEEEPTDEELIQAELLLSQANILAKQKEQDEVLAQILLTLNQKEV